jgi:hypothetical protein
MLSWLPQRIADRYVRAARRGSHYDCLPLGHRTAMAAFRAAGFLARDETLAALRLTLEIEHSDSALAKGFARGLPGWLAGLAMPIMPTYVFLLEAGAA